MFIKKSVLLISSCILCVGLVFVLFKNKKNIRAQITIGILQTVTHPALDRARDGLTKELVSHFGQQIDFVVQNAEGSMATAQTIAQSFHRNEKITAIVTLGTLATQAVSKIEKQKPIIFCAVTDPSILGPQGSTSNICGATDAADVTMSARAIKVLCPGSQKVALLFSPAEANSVSLVKKMELALRDNNMSALQIGVQSEAEILPAITMAVHKADVLWIPTDNMLANAISIVGKCALKAKKALFICDNLLVTNGVLAAAGAVDYTQCGQEAAFLAIKVLSNKQVPAHSSAGMVNTRTSAVIIHKKTCDVLGIQVPLDSGLQIMWAK